MCAPPPTSQLLKSYLTQTESQLCAIVPSSHHNSFEAFLNSELIYQTFGTITLFGSSTVYLCNLSFEIYLKKSNMGCFFCRDCTYSASYAELQKCQELLTAECPPVDPKL